jgi:hypothetical protein
VRYFGQGVYEITDRGRAALSSFLGRVDVPLEWLELDTEQLEDGTEVHHYRHPMTSDELVSFGNSLSLPDDVTD